MQWWSNINVSAHIVGYDVLWNIKCGLFRDINAPDMAKTKLFIFFLQHFLWTRAMMIAATEILAYIIFIDAICLLLTWNKYDLTIYEQLKLNLLESKLPDSSYLINVK